MTETVQIERINMSDLQFWKTSSEGTIILRELDLEKTRTKEELIKGFLLACKTNEDLAKSYAKKIGYLEGLDYIERVILDARYNDEDTST